MAAKRKPSLYKVDINEQTTTLLLGAKKEGLDSNEISDETIEIIEKIEIPNDLLVPVIGKLIAVGAMTQVIEDIDLGFNIDVNEEDQTINISLEN